MRKLLCRIGLHKMGPKKFTMAFFFKGQMLTAPIDYRECAHCSHYVVVNHYPT